MAEEMAEVEVFRFDPKEDSQPRYETYKAPYEGESVINVLRYIHDYCDPSLSFRYGCTIGMCCACMLMVNQEPVMGCEKLAEKKMRIEPHPKFEIIKDLVIDFDKLKKEQ